MEKSKIYIHRHLTDLPEDYLATVNDYLTAVANNIKLRSYIQEVEEDLEKLKGTVFDLMNQVDEVESRLSKDQRTVKQ